MREITSKNNQIFKDFLKLETKKYRDRFGLYLIEGENLIEEAYKNGAEFREILIRMGDESRFMRPWMDKENVFVVEPKLFSELAQTETSQGIIASVKKPTLSLDKFIESKSPGNFVVLDRLQDPGNIGTIIRTADAAGYELVIAMKGTADIFSPKVVRSATGSLFRVPIAFIDNNEQLIEFCQKAGKKLTATCLDDSKFYYEEDLKENIALIVGNEGNGIDPSLIEKSDVKIKIPMQGSIESLNAAVAAAIIMYESVRK
ncbi:MAG: RNA methyltransferase [Firmicutes bacterium]|nr:RNA methyltransferase [Bacillota bacterium]